MLALKKHRSSTSITDLDEDTLVEIIIRFPTIKHMVSCKLVSKLWYKLISSVCIPRLTAYPVYGLLFNTSANHSSDIKGPWSFACLNGVNPNTSLVQSFLGSNLPFPPSPEAFLDCCNGMLLFFDPASMCYYVCNPPTQQYVRIPNIPLDNYPPQAASLIFDPHYKIVYISSSRLRPRSLNIFSSASFKWYMYVLDLDPSINHSIWSPRSVFFDGSVYRLSLSGHLLKFNVRQVGCQAIELPKVVVRASPIGCFGISQSSLHYAWSDCSSQLIMVWRLVSAEHTHEWNLKHTISLKYFDEHPLCSDLHSCSQFSIYAFHPTTDVFFVGNLAGVFSYDSSTKRLETVCKLTNDKSICGGEYTTFPYSINLTPPNAFSQITTRRSSDYLKNDIDGRHLVTGSSEKTELESMKTDIVALLASRFLTHK